MKKRRLLLIGLAALVLGLITLSILRRGPAEPAFQGRKLSQWIEDAGHLTPDGFNTNALRSIRAIGTNAIPWLFSELDARDGAMKRTMNDFAQRRNWNFRFGLPAEDRHFRAANGFRCLGPLARRTIPQLSERLGMTYDNGEDPIEGILIGLAQGGILVRTQALPNLAWSKIEPDAADLPAIRREIIDRVRSVASDPDLERRGGAMQVLRELTSDTAEAIPIFLTALRSTNEIERCIGASHLGSLAREPVLVVPALIQALDDPSRRVPEHVIYALGNYHRQARTAVPALRRFLTNNLPYMRRAATDALLKIDPEGTAEADLRPAP